MYANRNFREACARCIKDHATELTARELARLRRITWRYDDKVPSSIVREAREVLAKHEPATLAVMLANLA